MGIIVIVGTLVRVELVVKEYDWVYVSEEVGVDRKLPENEGDTDSDAVADKEVVR